MKNNSLPLEAEFEIERLQLHLQRHPEQAFQLAVKHFEDYLELFFEYKEFKQQRQSPSLPPFPTPRQARLQDRYDDNYTFSLF